MKIVVNVSRRDSYFWTAGLLLGVLLAWYVPGLIDAGWAWCEDTWAQASGLWMAGTAWCEDTWTTVLAWVDEARRAGRAA